MVSAEILFSLLGGFLLGMMTPQNLAKLDDLAAGNSVRSLENSDGFLLTSQITVKDVWPLGALCLSKEYQPSQHGITSAGKHGRHHEPLTILPAIPACMQLLLCIRGFCRGL